MLSLHMDADGAEQLAKQLEVALAVEGVNAPEHAVRGAIASLLQLDSWANLQRAPVLIAMEQATADRGIPGMRA